ncbi:hypothetical protein D1007_37201 [Hordeum vulgare]|nr:hypothetical protein D1007_37201 [Hordeum vulgare]
MVKWRKTQNMKTCSRIRSQDMVYPSNDKIEFCRENLLACGTDSDYVARLWYSYGILKVNTEQNTNTSHSLYITSLKINPAGNTIITERGPEAHKQACVPDALMESGLNLSDLSVEHVSVGSEEPGPESCCGHRGGATTRP